MTTDTVNVDIWTQNTPNRLGNQDAGKADPTGASGHMTKNTAPGAR